MLSEQDEYEIKKIAEKYRAKKIILFGSNLEKDAEAYDIDLAIEGIDDSHFFKFYGELIDKLSKPVDIVDLKKKTLFNSIILSEGKIIYG